jgi:hypothetical protein
VQVQGFCAAGCCKEQITAPLDVTECHRCATAARYTTTMILYKPGAQFLFKGRLVSVDHVIIRRTGMWVRLANSDETCRPEDLTPVAPQTSRRADEGVGRG